MAGICAPVDGQVKPCRITALKYLTFTHLGKWKVISFHIHCVLKSVVRTKENKYFHCQMYVST